MRSLALACTPPRIGRILSPTVAGPGRKNEYALFRRDDRSRGRGWLVKFSRNGVTYMKFFADARHGGPDGARAAAVAHRDRLDARLPRPSRAAVADLLRKNNTSGIPGVSRQVDMEGPGGRERVRWIARWTPIVGEPARSRAFSVSLYGEKRAKALAIAARDEALRELALEPHLKARPRTRRPPRPPAPPMAHMQIKLALEPDAARWLDAVALERGLRVGKLVAEIVRDAYVRATRQRGKGGRKGRRRG